jgi:hypothetical protein
MTDDHGQTNRTLSGETTPDSLPAVPVARLRTWPARLLGLLLLLQAIGALVPIVLASREASIDLQTALGFIPYNLADVPAMDQLFVMLILIFGPLALALALAALFVALLLRLGWLLAMVSQSLLLLVTLTLHFRGDSHFVDPLMASGIVLILILNAAYIRQSLMPAREQVLGVEV